MYVCVVRFTPKPGCSTLDNFHNDFKISIFRKCLEIKKIICDCAMSLNDDREKNPRKGKGKSLRGKSDQSIVPTEISTGVLDSRYWAKILYAQSL